jgi:hypothetical protein
VSGASGVGAGVMCSGAEAGAGLAAESDACPDAFIEACPAAPPGAPCRKCGGIGYHRFAGPRHGSHSIVIAQAGSEIRVGQRRPVGLGFEDVHAIAGPHVAIDTIRRSAGHRLPRQANTVIAQGGCFKRLALGGRRYQRDGSRNGSGSLGLRRARGWAGNWGGCARRAGRRRGGSGGHG